MHQSSFEPHDSTRLSGSRPLTPREERQLVRHIRRIKARDRALISAQMFLGFRISEVLAMTVGHVLLNGQIRTRVALPPRFLKGRRGTTRSVPIGPELRRALERYLAQQARRTDLTSNAPLFPSSHRDSNGNTIAIGRSSAEKIIKRALRRISPDPRGLSTHSLRKSRAVRLYEASGHDLLIVRDGLGHRSVAVTQVYLPTARSRVDELILQSDWTHRKPRAPKLVPISTTATQRAAGDKPPRDHSSAAVRNDRRANSAFAGKCGIDAESDGQLKCERQLTHRSGPGSASPHPSHAPLREPVVHGNLRKQDLPPVKPNMGHSL